jgi:hypothetical protein
VQRHGLLGHRGTQPLDLDLRIVELGLFAGLAQPARPHRG